MTAFLVIAVVVMIASGVVAGVWLLLRRERTPPTEGCPPPSPQTDPLALFHERLRIARESSGPRAEEAHEREPPAGPR